MSMKGILFLCAQVLLVKSAVSQCLGPGIGAGLGPYGIGPGLPAYGPGCSAAASSGGGFTVTSTSPIAPTGVSIVSENAIEGSLTVGGNLPLLGSVGVDGAFPTAGAGAVSYGCGDGIVGISEGPIAGVVGPGLSPALAAGALGNGLRFSPGIGCGSIY